MTRLPRGFLWPAAGFLTLTIAGCRLAGEGPITLRGSERFAGSYRDPDHSGRLEITLGPNLEEDLGYGTLTLDGTEEPLRVDVKVSEYPETLIINVRDRPDWLVQGQVFAVDGHLRGSLRKTLDKPKDKQPPQTAVIDLTEE